MSISVKTVHANHESIEVCDRKGARKISILQIGHQAHGSEVALDTSSGGLQGDLFASNGEPAFYLHHGQVDRLWAMWQGLDFENRKNQVTL